MAIPVEKAFRYSLTQATALLDLHGLVDDENRTIRWPTIRIQPQGERKDVEGIRGDFIDGIVRESEELGCFTDTRSGVTLNPSPHVPGSENHMICWWWGVDRGRHIRTDMLALEASPERDMIIEQIAQGVSSAVLAYQARDGIPTPIIPRAVKIHGVTGHAEPEEREQATSPSRGAQSSAAGHINILRVDSGEIGVAKGEMSLCGTQITKMLDPYSEAILLSLGSALNPLIGRVRQNRIVSRADMIFDHKVVSTSEGAEIRLEEYLQIDFTHPISMEKGIRYLSYLYGPEMFGGLYTQLAAYYEQFWMNTGDTDKQRNLRETYKAGRIASILNGNQQHIERVFSLVESIHPTFGQVNRWLAIVDNPATQKKLLHIHDQYIRLRTLLSSAETRLKLMQRVQTLNNFSPLEAEQLLIYWDDLVADPTGEGWKSIEFVLSKYLSTSYTIQYVAKKSEKTGETRLFVTGLTIAPKFATSKGGAEGRSGSYLIRKTAL